MKWSEETFKKLVESIHQMFELQVKQRNLYERLLESLMIKNYKEKNPEKTWVYLVSYFGGERGNRDKYKTYETLSPEDKRLAQYERYNSALKYKDLSVNKYNLKLLFPEKVTE